MQRATSIPDDLTLLHQYSAGGDAGAFAELVRRYADMVYATARRVTGNPAAAEDVAQDSFLRLAQRSAAVSGSIAAWLHRTTLNRALEIVRSERARQQREANVAAAAADPPADPGAGEIISRVDEALAALDDELRIAVTEHFLCGRSQADIAAQLGVSQPTISRRIDAGLTQLRRWLGDHGVSATAAALPLVFETARHASAPAALRAALTKIGLSGVGGGAAAAPTAAATSKSLVIATIAVALTATISLAAWFMLQPSRGRQVTIPSAAARPPSPPAAAPAAALNPRERDENEIELQGVIPQLGCANVTASIAFYQRLGFKERSTSAAEARMVVRDDARLALTSRTTNSPAAIVITIEVKNITKLAAEFKARGVELQPPPATARIDAHSFSVTDPDSNRIVFEEETD